MFSPCCWFQLSPCGSSALGTWSITLEPALLFSCNLKWCCSLFLPIVKYFAPVLNSLRLCICNYFIDLETGFCLFVLVGGGHLLSLFYEKAIKSIEWVVWLDRDSLNEWGKALNCHLITFLMAVARMERRREGTEDFAPRGTGGHI